MLQQTRVSAVVPYYERFLRRFPDVGALAAAAADDLLAHWAGLGYYRRARHLKEGAERVVAQHGGRVPDDPEALLALPGVGRYTAGAILSIAFGRPYPVLDGNVFRVFARFFALRAEWSSSRDKAKFWSIAEKIVSRQNPGDFNQALMELGALVCTPKGPRCPSCPVRRRCAAFAQDAVDRYPAPRVRPATARVERELFVAVDERDRLLLRRRPEGGRMAGLWELPNERPPVGGRRRKIGSFHHSILHRIYKVDVYRIGACRAPGRSRGAMRWVARESLGEYGLTGMAKKGIRIALAE